MRQAIRDGRIELGEDGLIDVAAADKAWRENTDTSKPRNSVTGRPGGGKRKLSDTDTVARGNARLANVKAQILEIELEQRRGNEKLTRAWADRLEEHERVRARRLDAIPDRLAQRLAAETDPAAVHRMLKEEIRLARSDIARGKATASNG